MTDTTDPTGGRPPGDVPDDLATDDAGHPVDGTGMRICGSTATASGDPCHRPAGFGVRGSKTGPCRDHTTQYRVPKKLTPAVEQALVGAAQAGAKLEHCAGLAGIAQSTLWDWLTRGEKHIEADLDTELAELYRNFQRARAAGAIGHLREADHEFILQASYGYTKTEKREIEATHNVDPSQAYVDALIEANADRDPPATDHPARDETP